MVRKVEFNKKISELESKSAGLKNLVRELEADIEAKKIQIKEANIVSETLDFSLNTFLSRPGPQMRLIGSGEPSPQKQLKAPTKNLRQERLDGESKFTVNSMGWRAEKALKENGQPMTLHEIRDACGFTHKDTYGVVIAGYCHKKKAFVRTAKGVYGLIEDQHKYDI